MSLRNRERGHARENRRDKKTWQAKNKMDRLINIRNWDDIV